MKYCLTLLLLLAIAPLAWSVSNTLTTNASSCPVTSNTAALVVFFPPDQGGVTLNVSGIWTGVISFKSTGDGGTTWNTMKATPSDFGANVSSTTGNGMWQRNISGVSGICMLSSAAMTGTAIVTVNRAVPAFASVNSSGGVGGDTVTSPNSTLTVGGDSSNTTLDLQGAAGKIMAGATPALTATPTLGAVGVATGSLGLAGTTSGTVSVKPQAAAGTYNFNLPTTAGTSGQALLSGAGGSSPMTWGTVATNPMTTAGDMIIGGASGTPTRLPIGTNSFVLGVTAGVPTWVANTSGASSGTNTLNVSNGSGGFNNVPSITSTPTGLFLIGDATAAGTPFSISTTTDDTAGGDQVDMQMNSTETTTSTSAHLHRMFALGLTHKGSPSGTEASLYSNFFGNTNTGSDIHDFAGVFRTYAIPGASGGSGVVDISIMSSLYTTLGYGNINSLLSNNGLVNTVGEINNLHIDPDDSTSPTAGTTIAIGNERRILVAGAPSTQTGISWTGQVAGVSIGSGYGLNAVGAASSWGGQCCVSAPGSVIGVTSGGFLLQGASASDAAPLALGVHSTILSSAKFDQASTAQAIFQHTVTSDANVDSAEVDGIQFDHQFNHSGTNTLGDIYGTHMYMHEDGATGASTVTNFFQFSGKHKIAASMTATNAGIFNCESFTKTGTVTNGPYCLFNNNSNEVIFSLGNVGIGSGNTAPADALDVNGTVKATAVKLTSGNLHGVTLAMGSATGSALTTSEIVYWNVPSACTMAAWHINVDSGTATVKLARVNGGTANPTISNSINTSGVSISSGTKLDSTTLSDFTSTVFATNDTVALIPITLSGPKLLEFQIDCQ